MSHVARGRSLARALLCQPPVVCAVLAGDRSPRAEGRLTGMSRHYERYAVFYTVLGLVFGMLMGTLLPSASVGTSVLEQILDGYGTIAPVIIYVLLAPSLLRILRHDGPGGGSAFTFHAVLWYCKQRVLACLFAVVLASAAYGLPFRNHVDLTLGDALRSSLAQLASLAARSHYFYAIYAAVLSAVVLRRSRSSWVRRLARVPEVLEVFGQGLIYIVPILTLLCGIYVVSLPGFLHNQLRGGADPAIGSVFLFGRQLNTNSSTGIFATYLAVALLTGVVCSLWHSSLLLRARSHTDGFSIRHYIKHYFVKIYPLVWSTCSEILGYPASLHLMGKLYPRVGSSVSRLAVGLGSVTNINGTLICCLMLLPAVCEMVGVPVSSVDLLLCLPVIYVIGFGVPGIPGELLLFAAPIMQILGVPAPLQPAFLLTFVTLQIGLPDGIRSGFNVTDGCPCVLLLNGAYARRFQRSEELALVAAVEDALPYSPQVELSAATLISARVQPQAIGQHGAIGTDAWPYMPASTFSMPESSQPGVSIAGAGETRAELMNTTSK